MDIDIIQNKIYEVRGCRVMLDKDLAALYQVETKVLKQAVKRNIERFPTDFMFELTKEESDSLRSQFVTLDDGQTNNGRGQYSKYLPYVFTEQGVAMLSSILRSNTAIKVNISIMRAFVEMRRMILGYSELMERIEQLEISTDTQFNEIYQALTELASKRVEEERPRRRIGFNVNRDSDE